MYINTSVRQLLYRTSFSRLPSSSNIVTMHLDHQLPWSVLADHIVLSQSTTESDFPLNLRVQPSPIQTKAYEHFVKAMASTIADFARTLGTQTDGGQATLLSDELIAYPEKRFGLGPHDTNSLSANPLSHEYGHIEHWVGRASDYDGTPTYTTAEADLADAIKILMTIAARAGGTEDRLSEEMADRALTALLVLASHPDVPLMSLAGLHWGHGFGFDLVALTALEIYLLVNIVERIVVEGKRVTGRSASGEKRINPKPTDELLTRTQLFQTFLGKATADYDYPAQNIMHQHFWRGLGWTGTTERGSDPLSHPSDALQPYLRACFRILCVYHRVRTTAEPQVDMGNVWKDMMEGILVWWGAS